VNRIAQARCVQKMHGIQHRRMNRRSNALLAPFLLGIFIALSGCAAETKHFPSLLPRDYENRDDLEPVRAIPPLVADATLDSNIANAAERFAESNRSFVAAANAAAAKIAQARGAAPGSDAWLVAQGALGSLDGPHAKLLTLSADLDELAVQRAAANSPVYPTLESLRARVEAQREQQQSTINGLKAQITAP